MACLAVAGAAQPFNLVAHGIGRCYPEPMKRILVADDDKETTHMLRRKLESLGYSVEEVNRGSDVFPRVMSGQIDLVLLDYSMADERGDRVSLSIRSESKFRNLPILFLTGHRELEPTSFKAFGADEVFYKPVDFEDLADKLRQYLER